MKLWKLLLLGIGLCCQSFACQPPIPPQPPIVDNTPQPLWSLPRDQGAGVYGWFPQFIYENNLVTYTKKNGRAYIVALNKNTGQEVWAWSDLFELNEEAKTKQVHIYENILVWRYAGRVYAIDLQTGKTMWRQRIMTNVGFSTDELSGIGERFLLHSARSTFFSGLTRTGNITTGPIINVSVRILSGATAMFLSNEANLFPQAKQYDTLAVLPYGTADGEGANYFQIYNITQNKEIYSKTFPGDTNGVFVLPPIVFNSKIFFPAGSFVLCCDLRTGNELWRSANFGGAFSSGITIANGKVYGTNESGFSCCLDPETGKTLWQTRTRGGASKPFYMNGVIYFTSIADGHLYGLDAENGKILMKIDDPRGGIGFGDMVAGADGKIYANTYTHLYCFKAAR